MTRPLVGTEERNTRLKEYGAVSLFYSLITCDL